MPGNRQTASSARLIALNSIWHSAWIMLARPAGCGSSAALHLLRRHQFGPRRTARHAAGIGHKTFIRIDHRAPCAAAPRAARAAAALALASVIHSTASARRRAASGESAMSAGAMSGIGVKSGKPPL
jgi:hypothetical protein